MQRKNRLYYGLFAMILMVIIILDTKTALQGAAEGVEICMKTVIPSLFPFFFLSKVITISLTDLPHKMLKPLGQICKLPEGSEILLLLGLISGYPAGAQSIHTAYTNGYLSKKSAQRMLSFCNNAGPAFIFGMVGSLFPSKLAGWILWAVLIFSTIMTAILLPSDQAPEMTMKTSKHDGYMESTLKAMAAVCGWIIVFRVLLTILNRWVLWIIPHQYAICISGLLEISNGCIQLHEIDDPVFRFTVITAMLSAGGLCVTLQTASVTPGLSKKTYYIGKLLQLSIAVPISYAVSIFLFRGKFTVTGLFISFISLLILVVCLLYIGKNNTGNLK